jgi:hypothetical protein
MDPVPGQHRGRNRHRNDPVSIRVGAPKAEGVKRELKPQGSPHGREARSRLLPSPGLKNDENSDRPFSLEVQFVALFVTFKN